MPPPIDDYVTSRVLTMDFIRGKKVTSLGRWRAWSWTARALAEELFRAYLQQVLVDGFFHADPHPGNIFLTDDGRIALLDLGHGRAASSPSMQEPLLKLLLAVSEGRGETRRAVAMSIGDTARATSSTRRRFERGSRRWSCPGPGATLEDMQVGRWSWSCRASAGERGHPAAAGADHARQDAAQHRPRRTGRSIPTFDPNASIRRNAAEIMRERMRKALSPGNLFAGVLEMSRISCEKLPGAAQPLIDNVAENRLRIEVDAIDESAPHGGPAEDRQPHHDRAHRSRP